MNINHKPKKILVDYDCLQDTRLGVLNKHDPDEAIYYLRNYQEWHSRIVDETRKIDRDTFSLFYADRENHPEEFLSVPITPIILIINKLLQDHAKDSDARFYHSRLGLTVNYYPYLLSEEVIDILRRTIFAHLKDAPVTDVEFVRIPPVDITPEMLVREYMVYYCYSLDKFLEHQAVSLTKLALPNISIVSPKILLNYNKDSDKEKLNELVAELGGKDIFEFISKELSPLINIEFIDVTYFSFLPVPTAEEYRHIMESIPKTEETHIT